MQLPLHIRTLLMILAFCAFGSAPLRAASTFLVTQGSTLYRFQSTSSVSTFVLSDGISGMTTVPAGMTVGNLNGGAVGGDVVARGQFVYRIDDVLGAAPTLVPIGVPGGINASPVFVGNRLFGVGGALPDGSYIVEWDPADFHEINRWATGVFGGPGGLAHAGGNDFVYTEFVSSTLWQYTLGNTSSTAVGTLPVHDYNALEAHGGSLYAVFALQPVGSGAVVFGTLNPANGSFTQLAALDTYNVALTGLAVVEEPDPVPVVETSWGRVKALFQPDLIEKRGPNPPFRGPRP